MASYQYVYHMDGVSKTYPGGKQVLSEEVVVDPIRYPNYDLSLMQAFRREAELFVDGDLRPHAGVAVGRPRFVFPRVVAELARTRNRVERPQQLAGPHVVGAGQSFRVAVRDDLGAFLECCPDEDDIAGDSDR